MIKTISFLLFTFTACHAADLYWACSDIPGQCLITQITDVTSPNETINVVGQAPNFFDGQLTTFEPMLTGRLDYFPTNSLRHFPNVEVINLSGRNLSNLVTNSIDFCGKLSHLSLSNNLFTTLPAGFARSCFALSSIEITDGQLSTLDAAALMGLESLFQINLSFNKITCVPPFFFSVSKVLQAINLSNNQLSVLDPMTFKGLPGLARLSLLGNQISFLKNLDFSDSTFSELYIQFIENPIMAADPQFIPTLFSQRGNRSTYVTLTSSGGVLSCFNANANSVSAFKWEADNDAIATMTPCYTSWTPEMVSARAPCASETMTTTSTTPASGSCPLSRECRFYLDHLDRYTCVLDGVQGILSAISGTHISPLYGDANVTRVYFRNSFLSRIPQALFLKFENVDFVSVANSSLGMITSATLASCGKMSYLDARYNDIFYVASNAFDNCKGLQIVDFTGNPIEQLDTSAFSRDLSLKKVIINGGAKYIYRR